MSSIRLSAGKKFPLIECKTFQDETVHLGQPSGGSNADWQMVVVYRGRHCPLCTKYLNSLQTYKEALLKNGIDIIAVSADSYEQLQAHQEELNVAFPLAYGLTEKQMKMLGLFISCPRSNQETDHNFAEPGLFVVNEESKVHVADISNNPFVRPELDALVSGLQWIRNPENNYPIRGTLAY